MLNTYCHDVGSVHTEYGMSETEETRLGIVFIAIHIQYSVEYCIMLYV